MGLCIHLSALAVAIFKECIQHHRPIGSLGRVVDALSKTNVDLRAKMSFWGKIYYMIVLQLGNIFGQGPFAPCEMS